MEGRDANVGVLLAAPVGGRPTTLIPDAVVALRVPQRHGRGKQRPYEPTRPAAIKAVSEMPPATSSTVKNPSP